MSTIMDDPLFKYVLIKKLAYFIVGDTLAYITAIHLYWAWDCISTALIMLFKYILIKKPAYFIVGDTLAYITAIHLYWPWDCTSLFMSYHLLMDLKSFPTLNVVEYLY